MPYLPEDRKSELDKDPMKANGVGDYNYLYSVAYLNEFLKNPRYATIDLIREASIIPNKSILVGDVEDNLKYLGTTALERAVARDLAFMEFYRRIGTRYEEFAIVKNGDLKEYQQAEDLVDELLDKYFGSL
jgi:hypothetical protein